MSRTTKFVNNAMFAALHQIIVMASGFIIINLIIKNYGSELNGLISSINQFLVYFKLVEAGLSAAAIYALYKPLANNEIPKINKIVSTSRILYTKIGYIFISLVVGLAIIYPFIVSVEFTTPLLVACLVLVLGVGGIIDFFTLAKYRVLLTADQKNYVLSIASIIQVILNTSILYLLINLEISFIIVWIVATSSIFVRTIFLIIYVKKKYKYINYSLTPEFDVVKQRWSAIYIQVLGAIQLGTPILILTLVNRDLKLVSVFAIYSMVVIGINGVLEIFKSGLFASFGDILARNELSKLQKTTQEFEVFYYTIIGVVFSVTFCLLLPFINLFTNGFDDVEYVLPIVAFLFVLDGLLYNFRSPQAMLIVSAGMFKQTRKQVTIQGLIIVIFSLLLSPNYGIIGILIASIMSNIYRTTEILNFVPDKITKLPKSKSYKRIFRTFFVILIYFFTYKFLFDIEIKTYIEWVFTGLILTIFSIIIFVSLNILFEKNVVIDIVKRFKRDK